MVLKQGLFCVPPALADICQGLKKFVDAGDASGIQWLEARDLLSILQCTGQPSTVQEYLAQEFASAEAEKRCPGARRGTRLSPGN